MKPNPDQPGLFDEPAAPPPAVLSWRELAVEQIRRDFQTLCMDLEFWQPDEQFYKDRIRLLRRALTS
jgi:hypothetical protein